MPDDDIIEYRVRNLEKSVGKIETAVESIDKSLQALAQIQTHMSDTRDALERAFKAISDNRIDYENSCDKVDDRLRAVELQMPILKMTSRWIIAGVISIVGGAFATFTLVFYAVFPFLVK